MINAFVFLIIQLIIDQLSRIKLYENSYCLGIAISSVPIICCNVRMTWIYIWALWNPSTITEIYDTENFKKAPQRTPLCVIAEKNWTTFRASCNCAVVVFTNLSEMPIYWTRYLVCSNGYCWMCWVVSCGFYRPFATDLKNVIVFGVFLRKH